MPDLPDADSPGPAGDSPLFSRRWRFLGYFLLLVTLGFGFAAYQHPSVILQWETLMALCGLG